MFAKKEKPKPIPFRRQSRDVQSLLIRGVAQQLLVMAYPTVKDANFHFNKVGITLTVDGELDKLDKQISAVEQTVETQLNTVTEMAIDQTHMVTHAKMILTHPTLADSEKLEKLKSLLTEQQDVKQRATS